MIIDGVTYPGEIKEKAAAQERYSTAVARGQSAGIIRATGRNLEQFQVSVNVAPSAKITFELVYEELLKRQLGKYELILKVRPQQLVKHLQVIGLKLDSSSGKSALMHSFYCPPSTDISLFLLTPTSQQGLPGARGSSCSDQEFPEQTSFPPSSLLFHIPSFSSLPSSHAFYPSPSQIDIHIFEPQGIASLETESTFMTKNLADALTTTQNETKAHIVFKPSLAQQQKEPGKTDTILDGNFIVRYDVDRTNAAGDIQIENGYFVHHFAPAELSTLPKNVVFVIDKSGSMSGKKMKQTREALVKILGDLKPEDQFNLVIFDGFVTQWRPTLLQALPENVEEAKKFASRILAMGATNINDAVLVAVNMLDESNRKEQLPAGSVSMVILLTDGDPTEGERDPQKIQENVKAAIGGRYYLYCLGFGFDVNYAFLEKLALENGGVARRIYEDSDADLQLQDFYHEVANPLLTTLKFQYPQNSVELLTQDNFRVFFKGSEIVVAGKLQSEVQDSLSAQVKAQSHTQNFTFQTEVNVADKEKVFQSPKYIFHNFMERLWAYLTIQQLLEKAVSASGDEQKNLEARALNLSLKFNFVTPLTSMVVTKPEDQDKAQVVSKQVEADNDDPSSFARLSRIPTRSFSQSSPMLYSQGFFVPVAAPGVPGPPGPPGPPGSPNFPGLLALPGIAPPPPLPGISSFPGKSFYKFAPKFDNPHPSLLLPDSSNTELSNVPVPSPTLSMERSPHFILLRNNHTEQTMCVNVKGFSQTPQSLFSDPGQGIEVTGKYEGSTDKFVWLQVSYKTPEVKVRVTQDSIVVTRGSGKSSSYLWRSLYVVMPGLKMTLENGLLLLSNPDKVTIGLVFLDHPTPGLRLFLNDPGHFANQPSGVLGQFYQDLQWNPSTVEDTQELSVRGKKYTVTRKSLLDFQGGRDTIPLPKLSCWYLEESL
uniref:Inter-alpha-trypsin inhibitor heavy chain 4 n=1 Tax=Sarcophilus harrisii TaxID=9305 RepID=A0A7N4P6S4_SARHA